ncbi:septation regulator SpoVG [Candidatus Babeliales bacterium]|nr:septation regulator SpoVG [Candidatus Babeliales bacterium]
MKITEVKVYPARGKSGRLKAYATVVFDSVFIVRDLKVIEGDKGLFVSMPSRRRKDGSFRDIAHPLNAETRQHIEEHVVAEYNKVDFDTVDRVGSADDIVESYEEPADE